MKDRITLQMFIWITAWLEMTDGFIGVMSIGFVSTDLATSMREWGWEHETIYFLIQEKWGEKERKNEH